MAWLAKMGRVKHALRTRLKACYEDAQNYIARMRGEKDAMNKACCLFMAKRRVANAGETLLKLHTLKKQEKKLQDYRRRYGIGASS